MSVEPLAEPRPSRESGSIDESVEFSFHNGRTIEVVTAALPSGGFVILRIRVLDLDRRQWTRISSGSFWSFDNQVAAARHGRARAIFAINTLGI
jgi:hypothetical protein